MSHNTQVVNNTQAVHNTQAVRNAQAIQIHKHILCPSITEKLAILDYFIFLICCEASQAILDLALYPIRYIVFKMIFHLQKIVCKMLYQMSLSFSNHTVIFSAFFKVGDWSFCLNCLVRSCF